MDSATSAADHPLLSGGGGHIHLDAVGGAAGDMFVAALLDALPQLQKRVLADAMAVLPAGSGRASFSEVMASGIRARHFALVSDDLRGAEGYLATIGAAYAMPQHDHHGLDHVHDHDHGPDLGHTQAEGTYRDMRLRIEMAKLADGTAKHAVAILSLLAEAEAAIHGVALDDVHFHEIGDWDSLLDVVAAGSIIAALAGVTWSVSALPCGHGLVKTAHGLLPVPVPAAAKLLIGYSWRDDGVGGERVTPTGAAIIRHLTSGSHGARRNGALVGVGYGAGSRTLPGLPNVLRANVYAPEAAATTDAVRVVECDIDDMTGEELAIAADRLRAMEGVRDVVLIACVGKKGRPMSSVRLLVEPSALDVAVQAVLLETSTLGVRWYDATRQILPRQERAGVLRTKAAERPDGCWTVKVESDDLAGIATLAARRAAARREESL